MRNRELKHLGRGQQAMDEAKAAAEASGEPFIDEYDSSWIDPTRAVVTGEENAEMHALLGPEVDGANEDDELMNRGMRLNEAKKRKRERQMEEQANQVNQESDKLGVPDPKKPIVTLQRTSPSPKKPLATESALKKRKRDTTSPVPTSIDRPSVVNISDTVDSKKQGPQPKRLKISIPAPPENTPSVPTSASGTANIKTKIPSAAPSPLKVPTTTTPVETTSPRSRSRNTSVVPESAGPTRQKLGPKITIKPSKAASAEPPNRRLSLRRGSNASLPGQGNLSSPAPATETAPSSNQAIGRGRRKRPAPGLITADEDGSTRVSVGKRKAAPKKKGGNKKEDTAAATTTPVQPAAATPTVEEEFIDPNEPRYCVCGDVSFGTMIACDNDDVSTPSIPFLLSPFLHIFLTQSFSLSWTYICVLY